MLCHPSNKTGPSWSNIPTTKHGQQFKARARPPRVNPLLHSCFALNVSVTQMQSPRGNFAPCPRQGNNGGQQTHGSDLESILASCCYQWIRSRCQACCQSASTGCSCNHQRTVRLAASCQGDQGELRIQRFSLTLFAWRWRLSVVASRLKRKWCLTSFAARLRRTQLARSFIYVAWIWGTINEHSWSNEFHPTR